MESDYKPRLSIEIPQEKKDRLKVLLPHGTQKIVFNLIVDDLIDILETHGSGKVIGAFIERDITLKELLKMEV
jgi:hypothetical protein